MHPALHLIEFLLVDDDRGDIELTTDTFRELGVDDRLTVVTNGRAAVDWLESNCRVDSTPCVVLLDVNMPGMDGSEVLSAIQSNPQLESVNVMLLTSSPDDQAFLKRAGVASAGCLVKPVESDDVVKAVHRLQVC